MSELYYSQQPSVDTFLEHRQEFRDVGKLSIANSLFTCEDENSLLEFPKRRKGVYNYLFTQLNVSWEDFSNNQLSIITFNYDRSLEQYLFTALKHSHKKSDELVAEALSNVPIIHVHGLVAPLPWQETGGIPYPPSGNDRNKYLEIAREKILIVSEEDKSTNEFNRALALLESAERIYFLGFGYHIPNLKKLKLHELNFVDDDLVHKFVGPNFIVKPYRGSALGLGKSQRDMMQKWRINLPDNELNDLEFLKEYGELD